MNILQGMFHVKHFKALFMVNPFDFTVIYDILNSRSVFTEGKT